MIALNILPPATGKAATADSPVSGQYEGLTLAIRDGEVSGVFSESRGGNGTDAAPQFSCIFLLRGHLQDGRGIVETWYPGGSTILGNLSFDGGGASLMLRDNQDGCLMTTGDMVQQPYQGSLVRQGEGWIGVTLVTAARAVLYPAPDAPPKRSPYVIRDDVVAILERRTGWTQIRYGAGGKPVTGWVRATELALELPPARE